MSYLELKDGIPDFTEAVISLWFRVPEQSLIDVANDARDEQEKAEGEFYVYPRMMGILPLLTFGPLKEGYQIKTDTAPETPHTRTTVAFAGCTYIDIDTEDFAVSPGAVLSQVSKYLPNPSFIGIRSTWNNDGELDTSLVVRLQMKDNGSGASVDRAEELSISDHVVLSSVSWTPEDGCGPPPQDTAYSYALEECITGYVYPGGERLEHINFRDETELYAEANGPEEFEAGHEIKITPDHWHHALISFDLDHTMTGEGIKEIQTFPDCSAGDTSHPVPDITEENIKAVTNPCKMWIALDDVNLTGKKIFENPGDVAGFGDNGIVTRNIYRAAQAIHSVKAYQKSWWLSGLIRIETADTSHVVPTYRYKPKPIPSDGFPLGVPCTSELVKYVHHVEMAELQIFTGVTLDTAKQDKRRGFISDKGKPVPPSGAEKLLRRKPVVMLHRSGNWIKGKNTGSLGIVDGDLIPEGQFDPTGKIKRYRPDPSLHGKQGKPK